MKVEFKASGWTFTSTGVLETMTCSECGIFYALPEQMLDWARMHPEITWCCPNGHRRHFPGRTLEQKLADARQREQATRDLLAAEERSHAATRGHLTRTKKRVAHGVCPCCNRTFQQLSRHMKSQHPDYAENGRGAGHLPRDVPKAHALEDAAMSFLATQRRWAEVRDHLGLSNAGTANLLTRLLREGRVERVYRGLYRRTS